MIFDFLGSVRTCTRIPWITALVEYGSSNTAHVKYGPPIDSHYIIMTIHVYTFKN